ncbi:MAG TPA: QacE family quaternary ammonium compound efflux SMR transporter [Aliicoccus persicus]|uniref:QacE family quaternary ammonium compound efflux SMR transporter n=1 Tax=Aliicoccus persicus TaxID=930138 RepID=A0A921DXM6_9STAP|nr:QacE family quaternary ammonium compound efflux SMR transporter [Aliicoccus persicus]
MNKGWIYVFLTCSFELLWIYGFNVASNFWHWAIILVIIVIDFLVLSKATESLPTGTVYAIFAGAGTVGTALMDIYLFGEVLSMEKVIFIGVILIGVISLNLADNKHGKNEGAEVV